MTLAFFFVVLVVCVVAWRRSSFLVHPFAHSRGLSEPLLFDDDEKGKPECALFFAGTTIMIIRGSLISLLHNNKSVQISKRLRADSSIMRDDRLEN